VPLTAAEVRATKFSTTRVRAGYNMDEVDAFLDIVEADLAQYADELQRTRDGEAVLRTQCDQLQSRLTAAEERLASAPVIVPEAHPPADVSELVAGDAEAQTVLAIAERTADEMLRYAESRAEAIRASVRAMLTDSLAEWDRA